MKVALTGNPNSGKTTLFNAITGSVAHVGNWPGVTVEKKEGKIKEKLTPHNLDIIAVDLPGAYSLNPYTDDESVTSDFINMENPDIIINVVDATNLSRSLFLTTQLLELGIPVIVALNKMDLIDKKETTINIVELSQSLNCPVIPTSSIKSDNNGLDRLISECVRLKRFRKKQVPPIIDGLKKARTEKQYKSADRYRYTFIKELVNNVERKKSSPMLQNIQDKIDRVVVNKWFGIPIFIIIMYLVFSISQAWLGPFVANYFVDLLEGFQDAVANIIGEANPFLTSILIDGIIGGLIAVIGFLPLIMTLFFLMALLEDCGYMSRVAVIMDRFFKLVGLSGKSIIPMVIGTGCGIPGVMASRTIKDPRQRRTTAMLTPFMPCGAKLPIIALFAGAFFAGQAWVGTLMYFLGIIIIIISALIIRKITGDTSKSYFILELPEYRVPSFKRAVVSMLSRAKAFILKAATVILVCNTAIQIMQTFTWNLTVANNQSDSILASISHPFAILFIPLGFGMWQFAAATITGFIAKENVVGTLAVVFGISNFINTDSFEMVAGSSDAIQSALSISSVAALSFLMFNLFTPPCFACIGAIKTEMNSTKWTLGTIVFQFAVGYTVSYFTYQIGTLITTGNFGSGFGAGLIIEILIFAIIGYLMFKQKVEENN